jgi:hypothetical protein
MTDLFWDRIEPHSRDPHVEEGLGARVADPLWLLARQWQVGEFRGEDAASPIDMRVRVMHTPLVSFRNEARGGDPAGPAQPLTTNRPLESLVESQALPSPLGRFALAAEAGLDFLRQIDPLSPGLRASFRQRFALALPNSELELLPEGDRARIALLARRAPDGLRLLQAAEEEIAAASPEDVRNAVVDVWRRWTRQRSGRFDQPGPSGETWMDERLEHRFSIATGVSEPVVLSATEYPGGRVDWYSFDVDPESPPHALEPTPRRRRMQIKEFETLAVALAYAGMPTSRFWEFEDGEVYYGGIEGGPADVGRLLVAEFAALASDDWFLVPVRLPVGALARVERMTVRNTFGETHEVRSCAQWDREGAGDKAPAFAWFELSGDPSAAEGLTPWLALVPGLASTLHSGTLELVSFVRDEAANLVWAIEERIESASGRSLARRLTSNLARRTPSSDTSAVEPGEEEDGADEPWRYRLQTPVPAYWIPFVAQRTDPDSAQVRLRRARMLAWDELDDPTVAGPKGTLLCPDEPLLLYEEEIPRGGVQVTRQWQTARGADGSLHLWIARHKRPGRGERGSGLRFDRILRGP